MKIQGGEKMLKMLKKYLIEKQMVLNFYVTLLLKLILIIIFTCLLFTSGDSSYLLMIGSLFLFWITSSLILNNGVFGFTSHSIKSHIIAL